MVWKEVILNMKIKGNHPQVGELRQILQHVRKRLRVKVSQGNIGAKRLLKLIPEVKFVFHEAYETKTRKYCPRAAWKGNSVFNTQRQLAHAHYSYNTICISVDRFWKKEKAFKWYVVVAHELMHLLYHTTLAAKETWISHPEEFWFQFISIFGRQIVKHDYCSYHKRVRALKEKQSN